MRKINDKIQLKRLRQLKMILNAREGDNELAKVDRKKSTLAVQSWVSEANDTCT